MTTVTTPDTGAGSAAARRRVVLFLTPVVSVIAALAVGAVLIAFAGENPLEVYEIVLREALLTE